MTYCAKIAALAALLAALGGVAPDVKAQGQPAPEGLTGLKVGEKAPAFTLKDQNGKDRTLEELLGGSGKVALVFYRSADW